MIEYNEAVYVYPTYLTEILKKADERYKNNQDQDSIELTGMLNRKAFAFVH